MWAYSKIHTYSLQKEPFLHVDGDVFIWKPFDAALLNSSLIVQNREDNLSFYKHSINTIEKYAQIIPDWVSHLKQSPSAYNVGIIGGNNIDFLLNIPSLLLTITRITKPFFLLFLNRTVMPISFRSNTFIMFSAKEKEFG